VCYASRGNDRGLTYRKNALHKKWNANKSQYQIQDWDLPGKTDTLSFMMSWMKKCDQSCCNDQDNGGVA